MSEEKFTADELLVLANSAEGIAEEFAHLKEKGRVILIHSFAYALRQAAADRMDAERLLDVARKVGCSKLADYLGCEYRDAMEICKRAGMYQNKIYLQGTDKPCEDCPREWAPYMANPKTECDACAASHHKTAARTTP